MKAISNMVYDILTSTNGWSNVICYCCSMLHFMLYILISNVYLSMLLLNNFCPTVRNVRLFVSLTDEEFINKGPKIASALNYSESLKIKGISVPNVSQRFPTVATVFQPFPTKRNYFQPFPTVRTVFQTFPTKSTDFQPFPTVRTDFQPFHNHFTTISTNCQLSDNILCYLGWLCQDI